MITTHNLRHQVPIHEAELALLKGIDIRIQAGESVAIVGASGSGKSTLLTMLAGLDTPSSGKVLINDTDITLLDEEHRAQVRAQYIAFVFQNFQLLGSLTALENVMLPLEVRGQSNPQSTAQQYLERVGLGKRLDHYPKQLSGGEQQRVALARAFACEAPLLFADEPTGNLDSATGRAIADLIFELNSENNTTLILVTHDEKLAQRCQRQLRMEEGRITEITPGAH